MMINYEMLFYRLLDYIVDEVGIDAEEALDNIGIENLHEKDEIIMNFEEVEEERAE